jgi:hypothetical protein
MLVAVLLLVMAATFRIFVAHRWPNDTPDDGRVYAQIARNVLEQHVYSHEAEPPFDPSLIRLPGYPLFLAGIYSLFGHANNGAVRIVQALVDTATCALIALLAFYWQPDENRKRVTAMAALALAAVCPFTTIYAATILTEVPATFLVMAMFLAATFSFRKTFIPEIPEEAQEDKRAFKRALLWWSVGGLLGGLAVLFRPDTGLFAAAVGITLAITVFRVPTLAGLFVRGKDLTEVGTLNAVENGRRRFALPAPSKLSRTAAAGTVFSLAFVLVLVPWTIRNARVFHLFQPLAPSHGEMPGEFVPRGYNSWLRTWLDDQRYVQPFLWSLDSDPIELEDVPPYAFDSAEEKDRVAALLEKYNNPPDSTETDANQPQSQTQSGASPTPNPSPIVTPLKSKTSSPTATPSPPSQALKNPTAKPPANTNTDEEDSGDENDNSGDQGDEDDNGDSDQSDQADETDSVEMTPEIDAGFAQIARERIARHPIRYYVWLPLKRAHTMWFDTHSQYWPFDGTLLPLEDLDYEHRQHVWLPLFAGLTAVFTLLGLAGGWLLWSSGKSAARRWLLLAALAILLRLILFSSMENPEPRYLVEFFPFLSILGGIAIARVSRTSKAAP